MIRFWRAFLAGCRGFRRSYLATWRSEPRAFSGWLLYWNGRTWKEESCDSLAEYKIVLAGLRQTSERGEGWFGGNLVDRWGAK